MLRRLFFLTVIVSIGVLGTSCNGKKATQDKAVTLVMAEVNPPETIAGQMDYAFKQKVEELSNGTITIDLQCSGILGDVDSVMELMLKPNSTIQIHRMSAVNMAAHGCIKSSLLSVPFTFSSREHFWRFAESASAQEILDEPEELGFGMRGLFFGEEGFRHFFSSKDIRTVEDFAGLKIRGTNDDAMQGLIAGLHAESVPVGFSDLYARFLTHDIDVAEQPMANYLANHFNEVAPYMLLDGHTLGVMETVITLEAWNTLSTRQQQILLEAGKYASDFCRQLSKQEEERVRAELLAQGATITEVDDIAPWQAACADVIQAASAVDPLLHQEILNLAHPTNAQPPRRRLR